MTSQSRASTAPGPRRTASRNAPDAGAGLALARVVAGHGRHYVIEDTQGQRRLAHPRGKKSDCVVGDWVRWQVAGGAGPGQAATADDEAVVAAIEPRRNLLFRQDEWRSKSFAANIDQVLVWLAVDPVFSESLLARAVIAAHAADIPARIVLNKSDLDGHAQALQRLAPYAQEGHEVISLSLKRDPQQATQRLRPLLDGRATLVLGPSGTGKSTLINTLVPQAQAQVGEVSQALNSGRHTTTTTQWYWLDRDAGTALIDSPGFQNFGLHQVDAADLARHMPDIGRHVPNCRFYNCTHRQEPGCAVRQAVADGVLPDSRLRIYLALYEELSAQRY